jgi:quinol monooxygenase YgiN
MTIALFRRAASVLDAVPFGFQPPKHFMSVSLHPYFKAHPGKREACHALLPLFVEMTQPDKDCLYYEFTAQGDEIFCREAYPSAAAALAHLDTVGPLLARMLENADLIRLEIHGPAEELELMKPALEGLNPVWFSCVLGIVR